MKRLISLTLALLLVLFTLGSGAVTYADVESPAPAAEPEAPAAEEAVEAEETAEADPVNPYVGLWLATGMEQDGVYASLKDANEKMYFNFLSSGAIHAVAVEEEDADEDYFAYRPTGENTLDFFAEKDPYPCVFDPETDTITIQYSDSTAKIFLQRVTEDPLPDVFALVDHSGEERNFYGYQATMAGTTTDLIQEFIASGIDPRECYLTLDTDGTGYLQLGSEEAGGEITWTEDSITPDANPDSPASYTWAGDHLLLDVQGMVIDFAPEGEVEALLLFMPTLTAEDVIGTWDLAKVVAGSDEITTEDAKEKGMDMSFQLNEDGTAVMISKGKTQGNLTWELKPFSVKLKAGSGANSIEMFSFVFEGDYMILNYIAKLYFERTE